MASQLEISIDLHNDIKQATNIYYEPQTTTNTFHVNHVETKESTTQTISSK